jgi:hypothetical protein
MTTLARLVVATILASSVAGFAEAQQPGHQPGPGPSAPGGHGAATPEAKAEHHEKMMAMCREMMQHGSPAASGATAPRRGGGMPGAGMMGSDMMGMMPMTGDPRRDAEMMAMRGEIMKAVGDIMVKYAQRMQPAK